MLSTVAEICHWQFNDKELADPDLVDKLVLSICDSCGIAYPHFRLQLLISELVSNAIDHGVLALQSYLKDGILGYECYLIERAKRLEALTSGGVVLSAEWAGSSLLRISVEDSGAGYDYSAFSNGSYLSDSIGIPKLHGRGLAIIRNLCELVMYPGNGNCIVVEFDVAVV